MFSSLFNPQQVHNHVRPCLRCSYEQLPFRVELRLPVQTVVLRFQTAAFSELAFFNSTDARWSSCRRKSESMFEDPVLVLTRLEGLIGAKEP